MSNEGVMMPVSGSVSGPVPTGVWGAPPAGGTGPAVGDGLLLEGGGDPANLIAWWDMDEASNTTRADASSNAYDLTDNIASVAQTTGLLNNAADFDGGAGSDGLNTTQAAAPLLFPSDSDFSVSGWVSFDAMGAVNNRGVWGIEDFTRGYSLRVPSGASTIQWWVKGTSVTSGTLSTGTWYHVVTYHDSVNDEIGMIINDGTPITAAHSTGIDADLINPALKFIVGNLYNGGGYGIDAQVDEVSVWSKVLSGAEITTLYGAGTPAGYSDLAGGGGTEFLLLETGDFLLLE